MSTLHRRISIALWALLGAVGCGGSDASNLIGGGGECRTGQVPDTTGEPTVCVTAPGPEKNLLALPEYVEGILDPDTDVFDDPVHVSCGQDAVFPRPGDASGGGTVTVRGLLTKFGKAMEPVGLCVAILDYDLFMGSSCALGDPADWERCFGVDLCTDPGALREAVLGTTTSVGHSEDAGSYEIPGIPVGTNLVMRASGPKQTWVDTYKYGVFIPAAEAALGVVEVEASIISKSSWQTVPATAMVPRGIQPGHGAIAGTVSDCGGAPLEDKLCDPAHTCGPGEPCDCDPGFVCVGDAPEGRCTRLPWSIVGATVGVSTTATNIAYFQGHEGDNLPSPGRQSTNILGTYVVIDAPGGPTDLVASAHDGQGIQPLGRSHLFMVPRSVAIYAFRGTWTGNFPWYL